jgi:uncharacterized protein (TIRG00374 family)
MNKPLRKSLSYVFSILVGFGLLGGVLYYVGWRDIYSEIRNLGVVGIIAVAGTVLLAMLSWIASWWVILHAYGVKLSLNAVVGARLSGYAVSYLTPSMYFGGEPIRALMIGRHTYAPTTRIFATIVVERFLGGLSLIMFVLIGSFYALLSPQLTTEVKRIVLIGVAFTSFWTIVGLINFAGNYKWISRFIRLLGHPLARWQDPLGRAADKVAETEDEIYDAFTRHWKGTLIAFLIQALATFFVYMRPQVFFHFSSQTTFNFSQLSLLFTLNIMLSYFLWITPGGLGASEAALIGIFKLVNIGGEGAVAFSLTYKFIELLFVVIGLVYLLNKGSALFHHLRRGSKKVRE